MLVDTSLIVKQAMFAYVNHVETNQY